MLLTGSTGCGEGFIAQRGTQGASTTPNATVGGRTMHRAHARHSKEEFWDTWPGLFLFLSLAAVGLYWWLPLFWILTVLLD